MSRSSKSDTVAPDAIFSDKTSGFDESRPVSESATGLLDIESFKPQSSAEPLQASLFSKTRKAGFKTDNMHPKVRKLYEDGNRWVKGRFINHETPSGQIEFHMGPWGEIETHTMMDGHTYIVHKFVADHLNKGCCVTRYSDTPVEISPGTRKYMPLINAHGNQRFTFLIEEMDV